MNRGFWDSEANKFTLYGAIFGFLFPVIATLIQSVRMGGITWDNIVAVQQSDPLLWIIDSAPFFLGIFARFAGWRQDQLKAIIRQSSAPPVEVEQTLEDSRQFAGVLTFLAAGLISIVLFLVILWLQSLITSTLNDLPATVAEVPVAPTATATLAPTAVVITIGGDNSQPVALTAAPVGVNAPLFTATVTPAATADATAMTILVTATPQPTAVLYTATPLENVLRLGVISRPELDCRFVSTVAETVWREQLGIDVQVEEFATPDDLFLAMTSAADPQVIDATLCYIDPIDRPYLRQYPGQLPIVGDAFWQANDLRLLALRNATASLTAATADCVDNYLRNQEYDAAALAGQDATAWLTANQELAASWLACPMP